MTYIEAKKIRDVIEAKVDNLSNKLNQLAGKTKSGLLPDEVRNHPLYIENKKKYHGAFQELRTFNKTFVKQFKTEIQNESFKSKGD